MQEIKNNDKFERRAGNTLLLVLFLMGLTLTYLGSFFDIITYVKGFSGDGILSNPTLAKIHLLRITFLSFGLITLSLCLIGIRMRSSLKQWIKKRAELIKGLIILIMIILLFLIVLESYLRITIKDETSLYGFGPGSIKFNKEHVVLNNDLMRDRNYTLEKDNNTIRIAVFGDSFTFGSGINNASDVYVKVLEKKLNNKSGGKNYEVMNFGVAGYDFNKQLKDLNDKGMKYNPDIVIFGTNINDIDVDKDDLPSRSEEYHIIQLPYLGFWLRNSLYSYYFVESRFNRIVENSGLKENIEEYLIRVQLSREFNDFNSKKIKEMIDYVNDKSIKPVIVVFPLINGFKNYTLMPLYDFIINESISNGVEPIGILGVWKQYNESQLVVNNYDSHPNELAHSLAAEEIYRVMKTEGII